MKDLLSISQARLRLYVGMGHGAKTLATYSDKSYERSEDKMHENIAKQIVYNTAKDYVTGTGNHSMSTAIG